MVWLHWATGRNLLQISNVMSMGHTNVSAAMLDITWLRMRMGSQPLARRMYACVIMELELSALHLVSLEVLVVIQTTRLPVPHAIVDIILLWSPASKLAPPTRAAAQMESLFSEEQHAVKLVIAAPITRPFVAPAAMFTSTWHQTMCASSAPVPLLPLKTRSAGCLSMLACTVLKSRHQQQ